MNTGIKRALMFAGAAMILAGARLYYCGPGGLVRGGTHTLFDGFDREVVLSEPLVFPRARFERLDLTGTAADAESLLERADAVERGRERIDDLIIIYAYSPRLTECALTAYGRVNLTVAVRGGRMTVGCPLIKGSL